MSDKELEDEGERDVSKLGLGDSGEQNIQIESGNVEDKENVATGATEIRGTEGIGSESPINSPRHSSTRIGSTDMGTSDIMEMMRMLITEGNKKLSEENKRLSEENKRSSDEIKREIVEGQNKLVEKIEGVQLGLETLKIDLQSTNVRVEQNYRDIKCIQANVIQKNELKVKLDEQKEETKNLIENKVIETHQVMDEKIESKLNALGQEIFEKVINKTLEEEGEIVETIREVKELKRDINKNKDSLIEVRHEIAHQGYNIVKLKKEFDEGLEGARREIETVRTNNQTFSYGPVNSTIGKSIQELSCYVSKDQKLKFYGYSSNGINPKQFIRYARPVTEQLVDREHLKSVIGAMMKGNAEEWYGIVQDKFTTFDEFEKLFLDRYWDDQIQEQIRNEIMVGKYLGIGTRSEYAERIINAVLRLDPPFAERDIVRYLSRHFEREIVNRVTIENVTNVHDLSALLRRFDDNFVPCQNNNNLTQGFRNKITNYPERMSNNFYERNHNRFNDRNYANTGPYDRHRAQVRFSNADNIYRNFNTNRQSHNYNNNNNNNYNHNNNNNGNNNRQYSRYDHRPEFNRPYMPNNNNTNNVSGGSNNNNIQRNRGVSVNTVSAVVEQREVASANSTGNENFVN